jgi:hypothetical protein
MSSTFAHRRLLEYIRYSAEKNRLNLRSMHRRRPSSLLRPTAPPRRWSRRRPPHCLAANGRRQRSNAVGPPTSSTGWSASAEGVSSFFFVEI